jgi:excisionase family DNA binding protein
LLFAVIYFSWYKSGMSKRLLTTEQAATELGVNDSRVRQLIRAGELKAQQFGRAYLLEASEVKKLVGKIGNSGKVGRPPKPKEEKASSSDGKVVVKKASKKGTKK